MRRHGPIARCPESPSARLCMAFNGYVGQTEASVPPSRVTRQRPSLAVSMRITLRPEYSRIHICGLGGLMWHLE
jgi:hypothetical protein